MLNQGENKSAKNERRRSADSPKNKKLNKVTKIPELKDDRNKFIVRKGFGDKYFDKFSLKYEDLTLSGINPDIFDPNATTNNLLAFLEKNPRKNKNHTAMQRDKSSSVEKENEEDGGRGNYDTLKPIKGKLVELLKKDIE